MDAESLHPLLAALGSPAEVELLGVEDRFEAELDRLAASFSEPRIWIGHSLGGIAAMHLAARRPERCTGLVLMASNPGPDGPLGPAIRARQKATCERGGLPAVLREQLAPLYRLQGDDALLSSLEAQAERIGAARYLRQLGYAATRPGLLRSDARLPMPVLVLSAGEDALCPPGCGAEIMACAAHPASCHHVLAGAGHLLPLQWPAWCASHIRDFLRRAR